MSIWQRRQDLNLHTDYSTTHGLANRSLTIRVTSLYHAVVLPRKAKSHPKSSIALMLPYLTSLLVYFTNI